MAVEMRYTSLIITATIAIMIFVPASVGLSVCHKVDLAANETAQTFTSPDYPNTNSSYSGCQWHIKAAEPSEVIALSFLDFSLPSSVDCYHGYVIIYDGNSTQSRMLQRLCGHMATTRLTSTGPSMTVVFYYGVSTTYRGFKFEYTSQQNSAQCGNTTLLATAAAENLTSSGYPNKYPGALNCQWTIMAESPSQVVVLKLLDFSLMTSWLCTSDNVAIYEGNSTDSIASQTLCGDVPTTEYISAGSSITVVFQTGGPNNYRGFQFEYSSQEKSALCGNGMITLNGTSENITSPGYPYSYPGDTDCLWSISAGSPSQVIVLKFSDFSLLSSYLCSIDYVTVCDGDCADSMPFPSLCGEVGTTQYISSGPQMTVAFHTNVFSKLSGFKFEVTSQEKSAMCGNSNITASRTSKSLTSPGYPYAYPNNMDCQWEITADSPSHVIVLSVKDFTLEGSLSCSYDSVSVYDGADIHHHRIEHLCGHLSPAQIMSTGPNMTVAFHSDESNTFSGFRIEYASMNRSDVCRDSSLLATGTRKNITSMNYPYNYPDNLDCQWVIQSRSYSQVVVLNILNLDLESSPLCEYDYVTIYDGYDTNSPKISTTCGDNISGQFTSTGIFMTVVFHSDEYTSGTGFKFQYSSMEKSDICSNSAVVATSSEQHIYSPGYPHVYPSDKDCEWHITAALHSQVIELELSYFSLETSLSCLDDYLTIYDGPNTDSTQIISLCGSQTSGAKFVSSGYTMTLVFHSDESVELDGFHLKYTSQDKSDICSIETLTATYLVNHISSPNYPGVYPSNTDCQWHISADSSSDVVELDLSQFDLEGYSSSCYSDYVKIYDGPSSYSSQIQVLCGTQYYGQYVSTGSDMTVVFHSSAGNSGNKGFRFTYQSKTSNSDSSYFSSDNTGIIAASIMASIAGLCFLLAAIILIKKRMAQNQPRNNPRSQAVLSPHLGMQNPQMVTMGVPAGYSANYLPPPPYFYAVQQGQTPQLNDNLPEKSGAGVGSAQGDRAYLNKGFSSDSTSGVQPS